MVMVELYFSTLQYPVRPSFMTYDNIEVLSGKVKPDQKKVNMIEA